MFLNVLEGLKKSLSVTFILEQRITLESEDLSANPTNW